MSSQNDEVLARLKAGSLTHLEAQKELGVMRLAARVGDLKGKGYDIHSVMESVVNRRGKEVRVARYSLTSRT